MLNSRKIDLLRPDVAENCRTMIALCKAAGFPVLVTGTVRDEEFQLDCVKKGLAGKNATKPTFHSVQAGLAFDICKNVKGQEYSDPAFWAGVATIGKKMGFTWGGDWNSFPDKPHFQWDKQGAYRSRDILAGRMPPRMPIFKEFEEEETVVTYDKLKDVPANFRPTIEALMDANIIRGDGSDAHGNGDVISLTHEQVRTLVFCYRGGAFDKRLVEAGLPPAVKG